MSSVSFSTRQQRFACARLPDPHLTRLTRAFSSSLTTSRHQFQRSMRWFEASPRRATPKGRQSFISAQHRISKLSLHRAPFHVRDAPYGRTAWPPPRRGATAPRMSSTLPCWSTARHRYCSLPLILTNTSSRCHLSPGRGSPPAQLVGVGLPELRAPRPDRLVTHRDTAYEHQLLDVTQAQREPVKYSHTQWPMISTG